MSAVTRDRPILMSGPMVRAILREIEAPGTGKTQHRVPLMPQPDTSKISPPFHPEPRGGGAWVFMARDDFPGYSYATADFRVPWRPGMRAWVRETWRVSTWDEDGGVYLRYEADGALSEDLRAPDGHLNENSLAEAACDYCSKHGIPTDADGFYAFPDGFKLPTRPSTHMPRWASRLTLLIDDVRVQRLQDISEEDARAEGCGLYVPGHGFVTEADLHEGYSNYLAPRMGFEAVWNDIHGADAWTANPFVVALTYRPVLANVDSLPTPPADEQKERP